MKNEKLMPRTAIPFMAVVLVLVVAFPGAARSPGAMDRPPGASVGVPAAGTTDPFPTAPPDARLIAVDTPDGAGYADVMGHAGAVPAQSNVIIVNLDAHNVMTTTADVDGAFSATLFAPRGSSLLIKYETSGDRIQRFWRDAVDKISAPSTENLNPLPGTVIRVGGPEPGSGETQAFSTVGAHSEMPDAKEWAGWWASGEVMVPDHPGDWRMTVMPGDSFSVTLSLSITSPAMAWTSPPTETMSVQFALREMFGGDGVAKAWEVWFDGSLFTPTGLPIEHEGYVPPVDLGVGPDFLEEVACPRPDVVTGDVETSLTVPADLPEGYYRPEFTFFPPGPYGDAVSQAEVWLHDSHRASGLPVLRVGHPAPPRVPWLLFGNELINGHRGAAALEDRGRFEMVNRVTTNPPVPSVPRVDARSGQSIIYSLAPGASWLSNTDRRLGPPPNLALQYPSGELSAVIYGPGDSVETLGPAPLQGSLLRTPTTPGGDEFATGTGHLADLYELHNFEGAFEHAFAREGVHVIQLGGHVLDVFGNPYSLESTYEVMVARTLDIDPHVLPTAPFTVNDFFPAGVHLYPPVPAHVSIHLEHMPNSDPSEVVTVTVQGQANRAGFFHPGPGLTLPMDSPGEYRVDVTAEYHDPSGEVWFGSMTWGSVVESPDPRIEAHGRRGMDYLRETIDPFMPIWFRNQDLLPHQIGVENYYPYLSGDIHWGQQTADPLYLGDSIHTILTFEDLTPEKTFYNLIRAKYPKARGGFRWPPLDQTPSGLEQRIAVGEAPLFITTESGAHPELHPEEIDLWGYWYGSSQRPGVRVRELISEDNMGVAYWRFDDTYGYQIGVPANGDQPGDMKWEFGGLVIRAISDTTSINEYAIYSSFWVLLPDACDGFGCCRVTPPFQDATGASINGGPIMTLLGEDIDMLFLPTCVRPGDVLETGETVAVCGHVGPPLDSRVSLTVTSPSSVVRSATWHANKIGWLYDPGFDFEADEPGCWTVEVFVEHDRPYIGNGVIPERHNTGTVLGTTGDYVFYVVEPESLALHISSPEPGFIAWPEGKVEPIAVGGRAPAGTTAVHYTIYDKGVVMGQGSVLPDPDGRFGLPYDAVGLHEDFSMLSLTAREERREGLSDEVSISLLAVGADTPRAGTVTLMGEEVFVHGGEDPGGAWQVYLPVVLKQ